MYILSSCPFSVHHTGFLQYYHQYWVHSKTCVSWVVDFGPHFCCIAVMNSLYVLCVCNTSYWLCIPLLLCSKLILLTAVDRVWHCTISVWVCYGDVSRGGPSLHMMGIQGWDSATRMLVKLFCIVHVVPLLDVF